MITAKSSALERMKACIDELERLDLIDLNSSEIADRIRDQADVAWNNSTEEERKEAEAYSVQVYEKRKQP